MSRAIAFFMVLCLVMAVPVLASLDMGDLPACKYPTLFANPGHTTSGIAWLGSCVTADDAPKILDQDDCDDGIAFLNAPWFPCTEVSVACTVTAGPRYDTWTGTLYLNGWKDGNADGDFCDTLCDAASTVGAPEWIIQDRIVVPGVHIFSFIDPGVLDQGIYDGIFRFRLSQQPLGAHGYGLYAPSDCPDMCFGTFAFDTCGEVEDYMIPDLQLAVEMGEFIATAGDGATTLDWRTASELDNDHFEILRDGGLLTTIHSQGNSPTGHDYSFTDRGLENGRIYNYSLVAVDITGTRTTLRTAAVTPTAAQGLPVEFALHQNYPNPFNPSTQISFDLKEQSWVRLWVYDLHGRRVADLQDGILSQGRYSVNFDASRLPTGLYIGHMEAGGFVSEIKMLLIK
ncbi:MAG: hypothetical protein PHI18_01905 [bacterium]|nr:hypothetical protein [bacterium]